MALTPLQTRSLREIVVLARRENLPAGAHLAESRLAVAIGTSRFPISAALSHLSKLGVVRHDRNRGFFLVKPASSLADLAQKWSDAAEDPVYLKIADARQRQEIPDVVSEADLISRFKVSRNVIRKVLSRIQGEGWVERRTGNGWEFLPMIDSVEAYEESYAFRLAIEPAGILSATFRLDVSALSACRKQQEHIIASGFKTMTPIELFEANARFHETIAACSGNRFILQTIRRLDQLRRLVEYRQAAQRTPRKLQAEEHLGILDCILEGDLLGAAGKMRSHLEGARRAKVTSNSFKQSLDETQKDT
jgi:DNA-binding GntR family transcriptional regulator